MDNEMKALRDLWQQSKPVAPKPVPLAQLQQKAAARKRSSILFQYANIAILLALAVIIYLFLGLWFPYKTTLGKTGVLLMTGSLLVRVIIEAGSIIRTRKIRLDSALLQNTKDTLDYYLFRKKIHGPVTIIIVAVYSIGFYMLMPEFGKHVPTWLLLITMLSYPIGAVFIIFQIRKGIKKEINELLDLVELQTAIIQKQESE